MYAHVFNSTKKFCVTFLKAILCVAVILSSCKIKRKWIDVDPAFSKYIESYTSGVVSKTTSFKIQLASDAATTHAVGEEVSEKLFDFSPSVKGKAIWVDARTIEFKPEQNLKPNELYEINFKLGKVTDVPSKYSDFKFNVQTLRPSFKVNELGLRSSGDKVKMIFLGEIETADVESSATVEKLLSATQGGRNLKISWQHNETAKSHNFTVEDIERGSTGTDLNISWNGEPMNVNLAQTKVYKVPAVGDFKLLNVMAVNDVQQYASVQFSDPLAVGQDLRGLISISNKSDDITYTINGSEVKVFTGDKLDGNYNVNISQGIKNAWGDTLNKNYVSNIFFENRVPSVKIQGRGNILPTSGKLVLPFESINLNAVDISIIKIYENNIPQFLQSNNLGGDEDLRRVARPIVQKTLRLDDDKTLDLHKKQRFSLDIDKFLKTEPGAIYHITIGFRPEYSLFTCHSSDSSKSGNADQNDVGEEDNEGSGSGLDDVDEFWNRYNSFYPYGYNWEQKDNPCARSFYNKDRWASRNILASNIGLTAKRGNNNSLVVAVSSILSTEPMADVELDVLDYQQQIIAKGKSGTDGFATIELKRKPYLLVAKKGTEKDI